MNSDNGEKYNICEWLWVICGARPKQRRVENFVPWQQLCITFWSIILSAAVHLYKPADWRWVMTESLQDIPNDDASLNHQPFIKLSTAETEKEIGMKPQLLFPNFLPEWFMLDLCHDLRLKKMDWSRVLCNGILLDRVNFSGTLVLHLNGNTVAGNSLLFRRLYLSLLNKWLNAPMIWAVLCAAKVKVWE